MNIPNTIAGARGAAGATAALPGLAGGSGLDFSAMMGGVLTDLALPSATTGAALPAMVDIAGAAIAVDTALPDLSVPVSMPPASVAAIAPATTAPVAVPIAVETVPTMVAPAPPPVAPPLLPGATASLTVAQPAEPDLFPEPDPALFVAAGPSVPPAAALPLGQMATCMVGIELGGRGRPVAERDADAPVDDDETGVVATVTDVPPAMPVPILAAPPPPLPVAAVAAWRTVSQSDLADDGAAAASGRSMAAVLPDVQRGVTAASLKSMIEGEPARVPDAAAAMPIAGAVVPVATAPTLERPDVPIPQALVQPAVPIRADAVVPGETVVPAPQPVAAAVPAAVQAPPVATQIVRAAPATQPAMPPAMAMLQDISALLAEPAVPAQPVRDAAMVPAMPVVPAQRVAAPTPAAAPDAVAAQSVQAMPVMMAAVEPSRSGRRREGAGGAVEASRPSDGTVPASEATLSNAAAPTILPQPAGGAASAPMAGAGGMAAAIPADAALGFHMDAARHGQELDQVARDIAATGQAGAPLNFTVDSHRLGAVAVELTQQVAGLHVRLESDDATTRNILADQQQQLVTDARVAGVRIAETSVEAPRRDDAPSAQGGQATRGDPSSTQAQNGQSQGGQAGGQRGQGQPSQPAPGWSRGTREGAARAGQPAVTPRELYA